MDDPPSEKSPDPLLNFVLGYPRLAARMSFKPETAIFRRFDALNMKNLLYLQAELTNLEKDLAELEQRDHKLGLTDADVGRYAVDHAFLQLSDQDANSDQLDLVLKIRAKLMEYNSTLLRTIPLLNLSPPDPFDTTDLQHFLGSTLMGPNALRGNDARTWGSVLEPTTSAHDIIALHPRLVSDSFSRCIARHSLLLFKCGLSRVKKPDPTTGRVVYYDASVLKLTFWVSSIIASLVPIASIVVLLQVQTLSGRIGVIAVFNVLISVCLNIFTEAKRSECFAVAAAFTAVQVVFIGLDKSAVAGQVRV